MKAYINLLPQVERGPRAIPAWGWWVALGIVLLLAGGLFGKQAWALWKLDQQRRVLEARKTALLKEVQSLSRKLGLSQARAREWEEAAARARIVRELMSRRVPWAAVLVELARLVPEGVWLTRMETQEARVLKVEGRATAYSGVNGFVASLERSPRFHEVRVLSIKQVKEAGPQRKAVAFSMTCRIRSVQGTGGTP